ncbi:methyltransferase domain-containing protein [Candidatus Chloroploca sp. M-50]|uniref:Methyltransferase domain-containing protein n=1 Tax=Candidatus Chloroploca mongolica TaxID=2528176 RepID=A0ABS4D8E6_9CHLR|nr:methyltransferase domain-containing protein [Candidatus Chloroploca mongolica]MBP1465726.1 methyltransferase domain-containing protein [Candidatus Chloroploca mongolica]
MSTFLSRIRQKLKTLSSRRAIAKYIDGGRIPWSTGYKEYRAQYISSVLADNDILDGFRREKPLPIGYGIGLDERCVEYPWMITRLSPEPIRCLDAGSTLNHVHILEQSIFTNKQLYILTLAPEAQCFWQRGISYLYEDLRSISIRDQYFDTIISISTLEHVGFDNSLFTSGKTERRPVSQADYRLAMQELWRILKPGGQLLITVPFGVYEDFGTFQQFDLALLQSLESSVQSINTNRTFYRYTHQGWELSDADQCASSEYFPWCMLPLDQRRNQKPSSPDGAAAARAVACLALMK